MEHDVLKFPAAINKIRKMLNFRQNWIEKVTFSKCNEHMEQYPVSILAVMYLYNGNKETHK